MEALGEVHRLVSFVLDVLAAKNENNDDALEMVQFCEAFREVVSHFPHLPSDVKMKMMPLLRVLEKTLQQAEAWLLHYNQRRFTILGKEVPQIPGLRKLRKMWMARSWQSHMNRLHVKFQRVNTGECKIFGTILTFHLQTVGKKYRSMTHQ